VNPKVDPWILLLLQIVLALVVTFFLISILVGGVAAYMYHWEPIKGGIEEGGLMTILGITSFSNRSTPGNATPFTAIWRNVTNIAEYREGTMAQLRICRNDLKEQIRKLQTPDGKPNNVEAAKHLQKTLRPSLVAVCNMVAYADHCRLLVGRSLSGKVHFLYQYQHTDPLPRYGLVNKNIGAEWVWQLLTRTTRLIVPVYMTDIPMAVTRSWGPISDLPVGGQWHFICPVIFQKGAVTEPFTPPPPALAVEQLAKNTKMSSALLQNPTLIRRVGEVEAGIKSANKRLAEKTAQLDEISLGLSYTGLEKDLRVQGESTAMRLIFMILGSAMAGGVAGTVLIGGSTGTFMGFLVGCILGVMAAFSGMVPGVSLK